MGRLSSLLSSCCTARIGGTGAGGDHLRKLAARNDDAERLRPSHGPRQRSSYTPTLRHRPWHDGVVVYLAQEAEAMIPNPLQEDAKRDLRVSKGWLAMKSKLLGVGVLCLLGTFGSGTFADASTINLDFEDGGPSGHGPAPVGDYNIGGFGFDFSNATYAFAPSGSAPYILALGHVVIAPYVRRRVESDSSRSQLTSILPRRTSASPLHPRAWTK